jgi:adenylate cyclase
MAACHAQRGEAAAAAEQVALARALDPGFGVATYHASLHYRDPADREHHREALERAGFRP